jgi:protein-S-isoprenylcysteine O-methyltransferase Ste14
MFARAILAAVGIVVLTLIGWGLNHLSHFADESARVVALLVLVPGAVVTSRYLRPRQSVTREDRLQSLQGLSALPLLAGGLVVAPWLDAHPAILSWTHLDNELLRWTGVVLLVVAQIVAIQALRHLGRWYSPRIAIQPGHQLISTGPFHSVRHPMYSATLLAAIGYPAVYALWIGLPIAIVMLPGILLRIRQEELLLESEFGDSYREMQSRTRRLIPGVY